MKNLLLLILLFSLSACATVPSNSDPTIVTGKSLLTVKESIVNARIAISDPCIKKVIPASECKAADDYYNQSKLVYDTAVDTLITGVGDPVAAQASLTSLLGNMTAILIKYNVGGAK